MYLLISVEVLQWMKFRRYPDIDCLIVVVTSCNHVQVAATFVQCCCNARVGKMLFSCDYFLFRLE